MTCRTITAALTVVVFLVGAVRSAGDDQAKANNENTKPTIVYPVAIFAFEERGGGAKEMGGKVTDILFAMLATRDELNLVDREDLKKTLAEQEMSLSGVVKVSEANKIGQLTGAKILVTGSVIHVDKRLYLVAKMIGTETSRVVGASVDGKVSDELGPLVEKLAEKVGDAIADHSEKLVAKVVARADRLAALRTQLKNRTKPVVMVRIAERHVGRPTIDPAAQTELTLFCKELGFEVLDPEEGLRSKADILICGEGFSEFATRHGNLVSVKARVEIKAVDRLTDKVLTVDRQTAVVVDLAEQVAGKAALQEAAAALAERVLPKLVK
jgi:TolB-like protein